MEFGKKIKQKRDQLQLSQEEVANALFVTRQTVSNWELGKNYPDLEMVVQISEFFQISLDELLKGDTITVKKIVKKMSLKFKLTVAVLLVIITVALGALFTNNYAVEVNRVAVLSKNEQQTAIIRRSLFGRGNILFISSEADKSNVITLNIKRDIINSNGTQAEIKSVAATIINGELSIMWSDGDGDIVSDSDNNMYTRLYPSATKESNPSPTFIRYN